MFNKKEEPVNFLELVPKHSYEFIKEDSGKVVVLVPRFKTKWFLEFLTLKSKTKFIKVKLDEFGSAAWLEMDGNKKAAEIVEILKLKFGERIEPAESKTAEFFSQLHQNKLISFAEIISKG